MEKPTDRGAFAQVFQAKATELSRVHVAELRRSPIHGRATADDLASSALYVAFRAFEQFDWRGEHAFEGWVRTVLKSELSRLRRHFAARPVTPIPETGSATFSSAARSRDVASDHTGPSTASRHTEDRQRIECAFAEMPPEDRKLLAQVEVRGVTLSEMARKLGTSRDRLRTRLVNARRRLVQLLRDQGATEGDLFSDFVDPEEGPPQ